MQFHVWVGTMAASTACHVIVHSDMIYMQMYLKPVQQDEWTLGLSSQGGRQHELCSAYMTVQVLNQSCKTGLCGRHGLLGLSPVWLRTGFTA